MRMLLTCVFLASSLNAYAEKGSSAVDIEGVIATGDHVLQWHSQTVFLSENGGRTFKRVFNGPGKIQSATIVGKHLVAVRGKRLGVRVNGKTRWHRLPIKARKQGAKIIGGAGRYLVLFHLNDDGDGNPLAYGFRSKNWGRTWRRYKVTTSVAGSSITTGEFERLQVEANGHAKAIVHWFQGSECAISYRAWLTLGRSLRQAKLSAPEPGALRPPSAVRLRLRRAAASQEFSFKHLDGDIIYGLQHDDRDDAVRVRRWTAKAGWKWLRPQ